MGWSLYLFARMLYFASGFSCPRKGGPPYWRLDARLRWPCTVLVQGGHDEL